MSDDGMQYATTPASVKATVQLNKMREANSKYKSLLKLAKERIQSQEEELESLRGTFVHLVLILQHCMNSIILERQPAKSHLTFLPFPKIICYVYSKHEANGRTNESGPSRSH